MTDTATKSLHDRYVDRELPEWWLMPVDTYALGELASSFGPGALPKMHPEVKEWWIEALESGQYHRTTGYLKEMNYAIIIDGNISPEKVACHCCLGVLTEYAVANDICDPSVPRMLYNDDDEWTDSSTFLFFPKNMTPSDSHDRNYGDEKIESYPNDAILAWAGLDMNVSRFLAGANDAGASFAEIADFIRHEL